MFWFVSAIMMVLSVVCGVSVLYLLGLLLAAACRPRARRNISTTVPLPHFTVIVPAHDEEVVVEATLQSLFLQRYPSLLYDVVVVADNCTDMTAELARNAGAFVLERSNQHAKGKGPALQWAIDLMLARPIPADAFLIVDADTWVAPDFLERAAAALITVTDARGYAALQGRYGVLNSGDSWRSSLMAAAFDLFNHVKPLGRSRLGLGVGLKGNGMVFTAALFRDAPFRSMSVTEDIDYALTLAQDYAVPVRYIPEAVVRAQMPTNAKQAASQRARWEGGRFALLCHRALPLLRQGVVRRDVRLCDAAIDLVLPPLAELGMMIFLWGGVAVIASHFHVAGHLSGLWIVAAFAAAVGYATYILGGLYVSGASRGAYAALLFAPFYAVWKIGLYAVGIFRRDGGNVAWVRTARAPIPPARNGSTLTERELL